MADKPIIFSGPMVRALIEGIKTQTRRVLKLPIKGEYVRADMGGWAASTVGGKGTYLDPAMTIPAPERPCVWNQTTGTTIIPPYAPGDRLYVREAWSAIMNGGWTIADARSRMFCEKIVYRADGNAYEDGDGWWPSIHMPREFSRLTLTVTDVRVQRLQEISETDAVAEGVDAVTMDDVPRQAAMSRRADFAALWNSLHGPDAWDANPWVVALTFTVEQRNIDAGGRND